MNKLRAQEIAESPVMADVTCAGVPVYIQHVDADNETARIYPLGQPDKELTVALGDLTEAASDQPDGIHMICPPQQQ